MVVRGAIHFVQWVLFCLLASLSLPVCAHIPDYYNSVHFHSGMPDFGTPPRLAIISWREIGDDRPLKRRILDVAESRTGVGWFEEASE